VLAKAGTGKGTLAMRTISLLLTTAMALLVAGRPAVAQTNEPARPASRPLSRKSADLQEMLESGLKARRPVEFEFIALVVRRVEEGRLPESLVRGTFFWARHKRPFPFPYFERGLKARILRLRIDADLL
jgi:hypothetical protein